MKQLKNFKQKLMFLMRICVNAIACYFFLVCTFIGLKEIAVASILGIVMQSACTLLLLYITNILFNKARNSRLSTNGLRCITLATLVLGLYLICKALLLDEDKAYGLLASLEVFFAISSFMMTGLSIPLNIIIEKYLKPWS